METCQICFEDYRIENTKDHQCPDVWSCGACGELCDISEGTVSMNLNFIEFTHTAELCGAQDEIQDVKKDQTHKITLTFTTDRTPTEQEFLELMDTLCLQIEEPMNLNGEEHTYNTSAIRADLERGLN
jgi:hypothetical protein